MWLLGVALSTSEPFTRQHQRAVVSRRFAETLRHPTEVHCRGLAQFLPIEGDRQSLNAQSPAHVVSTVAVYDDDGNFVICAGSFP
jgi:hypothetical protein